MRLVRNSILMLTCISDTNWSDGHGCISAPLTNNEARNHGVDGMAGLNYIFFIYQFFNEYISSDGSNHAHTYLSDTLVLLCCNAQCMLNGWAGVSLLPQSMPLLTVDLEAILRLQPACKTCSFFQALLWKGHIMFQILPATSTQESRRVRPGGSWPVA